MQLVRRASLVRFGQKVQLSKITQLLSRFLEWLTPICKTRVLVHQSQLFVLLLFVYCDEAVCGKINVISYKIAFKAEITIGGENKRARLKCNQYIVECGIVCCICCILKRIISGAYYV